MNRIIKLICIGTIPLWIGIVLNSVLAVTTLPVFIVSILFLAGWGYFCFKAAVPWERPLHQAAWMSLFGFVMLVLILIQELIVGSYWVNLLGMATQLYFLPGLAAFAVLIGRQMETITVLPLYIAEMAGIFLTSLLGCWIKERKG